MKAFLCCLLILGLSLQTTSVSKIFAQSLDDDYEAWGLPNPNKRRPTPAQKPSPARPVIHTIPSSPTTAVPLDIAKKFADVSVVILAVTPEGKELVTAGWIVDAERKILMTNNHIAAAAAKLFVLIPRPGSEKVVGIPAILLEFESNADIAYLQAKDLPVGLPTLTVHTPGTKPTAPPQPLPSQTTTNPPMTRPTAPANPSAIVGTWSRLDPSDTFRGSTTMVFLPNGKLRFEEVAIHEDGIKNIVTYSGSYLMESGILRLKLNGTESAFYYSFNKGTLTLTTDDGILMVLERKA